jgi:hypothetical protein
VPRIPTIKSELAGAVRRAKRSGRLGAEHGLDVARARYLVAVLLDESTPRSAIAALDRRLDVILSRLGFVAEVSGPTELDEWLAGMIESAADLPPAESGDGLDEARELVADVDHGRNVDDWLADVEHEAARHPDDEE